MKPLSKQILCSLVALTALSLTNAYASCKLDYGIGTRVDSSCSSITFEDNFEGVAGRNVILSCGLRPISRDFSVSGNVMMVPGNEPARYTRFRRHPNPQRVGVFRVMKTGSTNFKVDPAVVTGEGMIACIAVERGGIVVKGIRRK